MISETKIIAEFCQNHNGDLKILEEMVIDAAQGGATYGKIQMLYSNELTLRQQFEKGGTGPFERPYSAELERLSKLDLSEEDELRFIELCFEYGMIPMTTVFSHKGANRAFKNGFKSIKIASCDSTSFNLINSVSEFAEELVISTGGTTWSEIEELERFLSFRKIKNVTILHCRTMYPLELKECELWRMISLRRQFPLIGWSDHTLQSTGVAAAKCAAFLGANLIELHFTVLGANETKDGPISRNKKQIRDLNEFIGSSSTTRLRHLCDSGIPISEIIGSNRAVPSRLEIENRSYYRGRVASKNNKGATIHNWQEWID